jgi:hypothetical protein
MEFDISFEFINGVKLGVEHVEGDEEVAYLIALDLLIFRFCLRVYRQKESPQGFLQGGFFTSITFRSKSGQFV